MWRVQRSPKKSSWINKEHEARYKRHRSTWTESSVQNGDFFYVRTAIFVAKSILQFAWIVRINFTYIAENRKCMRTVLRYNWVWGMGLFVILFLLYARAVAPVVAAVTSADTTVSAVTQVESTTPRSIVGTLPEAPLVVRDQPSDNTAHRIVFRIFSVLLRPFQLPPLKDTFSQSLLLRPVATPLLELTFTHAP